MTGSACIAKGLDCSSSLPEKTASGFPNQNATCRRRLSARSPMAMSLWPTSMPLDQSDGTSEGGEEGWSEGRLCNLVAQSSRTPQGGFQTRGLEAPDRQRNGTMGDSLFQGVQEAIACHRVGTRNSGSEAWERQVARLLLGDNLCRFSGGSEFGSGQSGCFITLPHPVGPWSSEAAEEATP